MVPFTTAVPMPGEFPVVCWIPPVTVPAGSSADLKFVPLEAVAVAASWFPLLSLIWNIPENVPFNGKMNPKFAAPLASLVKDVTLEHPLEPFG
jgi:hypothetical protein